MSPRHHVLKPEKEKCIILKVEKLLPDQTSAVGFILPGIGALIQQKFLPLTSVKKKPTK